MSDLADRAKGIETRARENILMAWKDDLNAASPWGGWELQAELAQRAAMGGTQSVGLVSLLMVLEGVFVAGLAAGITLEQDRAANNALESIPVMDDEPGEGVS